MNDRIKELAKQCWNERWEGQLHFDNEKFAELIVRECAEVCMKEIDIEWLMLPLEAKPE